MLEILKIPTESLRKPSVKIEKKILLSDEIQQLIKDMITTMYGDDGVGLAAPQVKKNIRICVIGKESIKKDYSIISKINDINFNKDIILVNPKWTKLNRKTTNDIEGCLSVPKTYGKVKRCRDITVEAMNKKGENIKFEAYNFFARVIQHEIDHLDGILFIDKAKDIYLIAPEIS